MQGSSTFIILAPLAALVLGAIALGGGIYETLLVDRIWPHNPALIQPGRGGINRALFWMPIHSLYEVALLITAWLLWNVAGARSWVLVALVAHFSARIWSFAYFIPRAIRFERLTDLTEDQVEDARRWTQLSRFRPVLEAVSLVALSVLVVHLAREYSAR